MIKHLTQMSEKVIEQAPHLARAITDGQQVRYPTLLKFEKKLYPSRIRLVELCARTLIMDEENRIETLREWGEKEGTELAKYSVVTLDMLLREVPNYRKMIGAVMKQEALALGLTPSEMYDAIDTLDSAVDEITYFFSVPFVRHEKEMLKLSQSAIMELSVPIVSIDNETAILPLVGMLDYDRARILEERVLAEASELQLENLIIDLSGLQTTDTYVARQLYNLFDALSLLGIQPIVSGITPSIAQTLVHLGLSFGRTKSFATLKQALSSIK